MTEQNTTGAGEATATVATVAAPTEAAAPQAAVPAQPQAPEAVPQDGAPQDAAPQDAAPAPAPAPKDRRKLFAFLRWTAAVTVFAVAGAGVAYGITQPERTEIPGLSTEDDGRWVFPELVKPVLPAGAAQPFGEDNEDGIHYAGLTELLLPAPKGSAPDSTLKLEKDSVIAVDTFLEEYESTVREKMKQAFVDDGLRQIVGRGWLMPDGTRTRIYLLRFHSSGFADTFEGCDINMNVNGVNRMTADGAWSKAKLGESTPDLSDLTVLEEVPPVGDEQLKVGCLQAGDIRAAVFQTRKGEVASVPFHQTVILQDQLLH